MIVIRGHLGFGDCIHQRAIVRDLMDNGEEVVLRTFYGAMYHDLRARGLRLLAVLGHPPRVAEQGGFVPDKVHVPVGTKEVRLRYNAETVHRHGSILAAQYACAGMTMPKRPDFSLPVLREWRDAARRRITYSSKPLMVYRPAVLNNLFRCEQRLPDLDAYATLFDSIRDDYHVVSVCNLGNYGEEIAGPKIPVDVEFHRGELSFQELVGLYAEADLAFTCAGFAPVLAQAVGTCCVVVYGGHEGFRTTNSVGRHLAPMLAIQPVNVCECHGGHYTRGPNQELVRPVRDHDCDKTLDMPLSLARLRDFAKVRDYAHA